MEDKGIPEITGKQTCDRCGGETDPGELIYVGKGGFDFICPKCDRAVTL